MEAKAKENPDMAIRLTALKEYASRLDTAEKAKPQTAVAAAKPAATATAPASITPAVAANTPAPAKPVANTDAQYKAMNPTQLAAAIQKDNILPDKVQMGRIQVDLAEALKDKNYRKTYLESLEKAEAKGSDLHTQIAMIKAYDTALTQSAAKPASQMSQQFETAAVGKPDPAANDPKFNVAAAQTNKVQSVRAMG